MIIEKDVNPWDISEELLHKFYYPKDSNKKSFHQVIKKKFIEGNPGFIFCGNSWDENNPGMPYKKTSIRVRSKN